MSAGGDLRLSPWIIWARRGLSSVVVVATVTLILVIVSSGQPWLLDARWAVRQIAVTLPIVVALVAATAAYEVAQRVHPTLAEIGASGTRGRWASVVPVALCIAAAWAPYLVTWVAAPFVSRLAGGLAGTDWWLYLEVTTTLVTVGVIGATCGTLMRGVPAVLGAVGVTLLVSMGSNARDVVILRAATSSGTLIGGDRTPARALMLISANVAIGVTCVLLLKARDSSGQWARSRACLALVPAVAVLTLTLLDPLPESEYRPTHEATTCIGTSPRLCGPRSAAPLLRLAQQDLAGARTHLAGTGLPLSSSFTVARGEAALRLPDGTSLLEYDPSEAPGGHLSRRTIARSFAAPRMCRAFIVSSELSAGMPRLDAVAEFLYTELGKPTVDEAPSEIRDAFQWLLTCPMTSVP